MAVSQGKLKNCRHWYKGGRNGIYAELRAAYATSDGPEITSELRWALAHPKTIDKSSPSVKQEWFEKAREAANNPKFGYTYCDKPSYQFKSPPQIEGENANVEFEIHCGKTLMRTHTYVMNQFEGKWYLVKISKPTTYIDTNSGKLTAIR